MNIKNLSKKQSLILYTIAAILIATIVCVAVFQLYSSNNDNKMLAASSAYQKALITGENTKSSLESKVDQYQLVINNYPDTSFGIFASWQLADLYITPTKLDTTSFNINIANIPKAIDILQQSVDKNPKDNLTNITKVRIARLYIVSKQPKQAITILLSISSLEDSSYPLVLLGQAYNDEGDKTKAVQVWQKAIQNPNGSQEFKQIITQFINNSN